MKLSKLILLGGVLSLTILASCGGGGDGDNDADDGYPGDDGTPTQPAPPTGGDDNGGSGGDDTNQPPNNPPSNPSPNPQPNPSPNSVSFSKDVYPILNNSCQVCHNPNGVAKGTKFIVSDTAGTYNSVLGLIDTANPANSKLLKKATNQDSHGGGQVIAPNSDSYNTILQWIQQGASNN